jgi:hypothetical protein
MLYVKHASSSAHMPMNASARRVESCVCGRSGRSRDFHESLYAHLRTAQRLEITSYPIPQRSTSRSANHETSTAYHASERIHHPSSLGLSSFGLAFRLVWVWTLLAHRLHGEPRALPVELGI